MRRCRFPGSCGPTDQAQSRTLDKVAGRTTGGIAALEIRLGKLKLILGQEFSASPGPRVTLFADRGLARCWRCSLFHADEHSQNLQHGAPFAGGPIQYFCGRTWRSPVASTSRPGRGLSALEIVIVVCQGGSSVGVCCSGLAHCRRDPVGSNSISSISAPFGSGQSRRGKLSPPPFRQQEVLDIPSVVGRQLQGLRE